METQTIKYGAKLVSERAPQLASIDDGFSRKRDASEFVAKSVLIATGVTNRTPDIDDALHTEAPKLGLIRYCPVCDGFEITAWQLMKRLASLVTSLEKLEKTIAPKNNGPYVIFGSARWPDCVHPVTDEAVERWVQEGRAEVDEQNVVCYHGGLRGITSDEWAWAVEPYRDGADTSDLEARQEIDRRFEAVAQQNIARLKNAETSANPQPS